MGSALTYNIYGHIIFVTAAGSENRGVGYHIEKCNQWSIPTNVNSFVVLKVYR
jgi:hypothetical protein